MYINTIFRSTETTLVILENFRFWDQICPKECDKKFGKINIKVKMRIWLCMPVPRFSQFGEPQFLKLNLTKKDFRVEY